jgi:hypothetical protein
LAPKAVTNDGTIYRWMPETKNGAAPAPSRQ